MDGWSLRYEGFEPAREGLREALCTLGNGIFATRGAAPEAAADEVHYPGTYAAGCYNRLTTEIAGRQVENEDLVNLPNWLALTFRIDGGEWFHPGAVTLLAYRQELDMRRGVLCRRLRCRDAAGRETSLAERRMVHVRHRHLAALETTLTPENWSGELEIRSALDGRVVNAGVPRYRSLANQHLRPLESGALDDDTVAIDVETVQSGIRIALAARTRLSSEGEALAAESEADAEPGYAARLFRVRAERGRAVTVDKVAALYTSRQRAISEPGLAARQAVMQAAGFPELLAAHELAWEHLWSRFGMDVDVEGAPSGNHPLTILRLHIFHLLQTVTHDSEDVDAGVPARGLHGEAYRGHVFWDELFVLPLLTLRESAITRNLLLYRYRRLSAARRAARAAGHAGAMYPWQSGSDGREESQGVHLNPRSQRWVPDNSRLQRHVSAAVAYNVWQYFQVTNDIEFMATYGAEMVLEIARFWASLADFDEAKGRYVIRGVMGPDEYHDAYPGAERPGLDNNAYTNVMAVWVLARALELLEFLPSDLCRMLRERLGIDDTEVGRWEAVSRRMFVPFHDDGIISQFEGYAELERFDWERHRARYGDIQRLDRILEAEDDTPNRYQASKQADVLMLFYLFSADDLRALFERLDYPFDPADIPHTVEYYLQRTSHGSTLSRVVHSWVLARSDRPRSWSMFAEALESDVADIQGGTTSEGIHLGAMAGTVELVQRCYTGLEIRREGLRLSPMLPEPLHRLEQSLWFRGHSLHMEVTGEHVRIDSAPGPAEPIRVAVRDDERILHPGQSETFEQPPCRRAAGG